MQHGYDIRRLPHKIHIVLNDDDRAFLLNLTQDFAGLEGLGLSHACRRFVEHDDLRLLHELHTDLEPLFLTMRQRTRPRLRLVEQADLVEHAVDLLKLFRCRPAEQRIPDALVPLERQHHVVPDGQAAEHARHLKLAADALADDFILRHTGQAHIRAALRMEDHAACGRSRSSGSSSTIPRDP